jgi:hypothetical protein
MHVADDWDAAAAASDLAAVNDLLAAAPGAGPEERLRAMAAHFDRRYGAVAGPRVLGAFVRLCLYLDRFGAELRARGLMDEAGRTINRAFLEVLLERLAAGDDGTVAAVPARDLEDDTVES